MKRLTPKTVILLICILSFCSCTTTFYQISTLSSNNVLGKGTKYSFSNDNVEISYDFWSIGGIVSFTITNNSDYDLAWDKKNSSFIENGTAYDYFLNRVNSYGSITQTTNSNLASLSGKLYTFDPKKYYNASLSSNKSVSYGQSSGVEYYENEFEIIPSHSSKSFTEYIITDKIYRECGLARDPKKNENASMQFSETDSPYLIENRLALCHVSTDPQGNHIYSDGTTISNKFYVSEIRNYPASEIIKLVTYENCDGTKTTTEDEYCTEAAANKFYKRYVPGTKTDRTKNTKNTRTTIGRSL